MRSASTSVQSKTTTKANKKLSSTTSMTRSARSVVLTAKLTACKNCGSRAKCHRREFSLQAWTALLLWEEVSVEAICQPLCEDCYTEMRETLIDRNSEVELAVSSVSEKVSGQIQAIFD